MSLHSFRSALALSGALVSATLATAAAAQTFVPIREPLSDAACTGANVALANCTVTGTRTNTAPVNTVAPANATSSTITHTESVTFNGDLQVAGRPVTLSGTTPFTVPPTFVFDPAAVKVNVTTAYDGEIKVTVPNANVGAALGALSAPQGLFQRYTFSSLTTNSIDVDVEGGSITDVGTGTTYTYDLSAVNPAAITNNATALSGVYRSDPTNSGAIVFGTIAGTAQLVAANAGLVVSPAPILLDGSGNPTGGWVSPFALDYALTAVETTRLDETGLATPKVEVTQGIEMNGSRITGLAAGTAATDAVNKGQLDAESTARQAADVTLTNRIATEENTRQSADLALTQRIATEESARAALSGALTSETNARLAADLGLQNQIGALGNRVGNLEAHVAELDDRVASSTAIAVAMGGATFLPGMKFNLTANVATYDGAHAGSLQIGALVSDHVAVNAGVATGFNRRGKTAGRVGVTFGW
ncbi:MAG TPA: YadA-like family protein [Novosphingobium sp.]|nr:YadA-like family protein [Novosphingobium sp.]HPZ45649.1 YadA-like family protein [Novosphingobium sp.]HQD98281.1 YadA-like family protein [Novosphingobium sp.]